MPAVFRSPINAGAFRMIVGLVTVPLVSLVTKAPDKAAVEHIFACCRRKVEVTVKYHIGSENRIPSI